MELQPNDTELVGGWIVEGRRVRGDATCERVEHLIKTHLKQVAISQNGALGRRYSKIQMTIVIGSERISRVNNMEAVLLDYDACQRMKQSKNTEMR